MPNFITRADRIIRTPFDFILPVQPFLIAADGEGGGEGGGTSASAGGSAGQAGNNGQAGATGTDYVSRAALDAIISERDRAKNEAAEAKKHAEELKAAKAAFDELTGGDLESFKKTFSELTEFKKTSEEKNKTELEKLQGQLKEMEGLSAKQVEKLTKEHGTVVENLTKQLEDNKATIAALRDTQLKSALYKAAVENNAANPEQIVLMLSGQFSLNDKGEHIVVTKDAKGVEIPKNVDEYTKEFLALEQNANLLAGNGVGPRKSGIDPKAPGQIKKGPSEGDGKGKGGDTYLAKLGRPISDADRSEFSNYDYTDEEIAMQLVMRQNAKEKMAKLTEGSNGLLFGERQL